MEKGILCGNICGNFVNSSRVRIGAYLNYFLEQFTGASAAYSLRKLSKNSTYAIRVRRDSDDSEQDIGFVDRNLDTDSLLAFVGVGDGFVTTIYDQSGQLRHLTQSVSANQATIVTDGVVEVDNAMPCLKFDGIDDYYNFPDLNAIDNINNASAFVVGNVVESDNQSLLTLSAGGKRWYLPIIITTQMYAGYGASATAIHLGEISGIMNLFTMISDPTNNVNAYLDSIQKGSVSSEDNVPIDESSLGKVGTLYFGGNFSEAVIYNSSKYALREEIESKINSHYNIY